MEEEIREKIIYGAGELILKYGIRSISMDEISKHLSVSKKTLYQYFKDKEELLLQVSQEHLKAAKQCFVQASQEAGNAIEETILLATGFRKQKQASNAAILFDLQKYYPKVYALWEDFHYNYIHQQIVRNITNGIKDGLFRSEIKPAVMAVMRILCVEAACGYRDAFAVTKENANEIHEQLLTHFLLGLCTDKGRKLFMKHKEALKLKFTN